MHTHLGFFPGIFFPDDLDVMMSAHRMTMAQTGGSDLDPQDVARIALRLYTKGLIDEDKLAEVTGRIARRHLAALPHG